MLRLLKLLFLFQISCLPHLGAQGAVVENKMDVFRLPNDTEPVSYRLTVRPTMDSKKNVFTFTGEVTIRIRAKTATKVVTLNSDGLELDTVAVMQVDVFERINVIESVLVPKNQQIKITLDQPGLVTDRLYDVQIKYSGALRDDMTGFYRSYYLDKESNTTKWLAVTQFEPAFARRAFPCYDEPAFKTPFEINIERIDNQISLSNMQIDRSFQVGNSPPNYIRDQYYPTEPISTYLVAFSVSEFINATQDQRVRVYTHKEYADQVKYIKEKANQLLKLMEVYTNIPYPYPKVDLLALPDMGFGAMENWGLTTYKEKYLLVTNKSTEKDKELATTTVQHELAHQWFGDLVTCSSWNYVWLNEAFATLFEYFAVQVAERDWRVGDLFIIEQHQEALVYDHRPKHPITASLLTPEEFEDTFDKITYNKGASVLRMLKFALTDDLFRASLMLYLDTYKYKSVEPKNLWDSFDNVLFEANYKLGNNSITVGEFMSTWTDQAGYPIINVETSENGTLILTQKLFQVDEPRVNDTTLWHIGLSYTTENDKQFNNVQPSVWMKNTESIVIIPQTKNTGWVLFNLQSTGFYRVNYDQKNWDLLIAELIRDPKEIHVLNRAQLIDDSFNLARAGELSHFVPLTLINYLEKEDDFIPWYSVKNAMSYLVERMRRCSHTGPQMREFTRKYAEIVYQKVSHLYQKKDSKHLTKTSMQAFSNWACRLEVEACVQSASNYFNSWRQNRSEIPPDVKESALCVGVQNGTQETWDGVYGLFLNTSSTSERQAALLALSCSTNSTVLSRYLDLLLEANCSIRHHEYKTVFRSLASTPVGINVTTSFLQNKINQTLSKMWKGEQMVMLMYETLSAAVATVKEMNELNAIRNYTYLSPAVKESFDNSYKEVELNSAYYERSHPLLHNWFNPSKVRTTPATSSATLNSHSFINVIFTSLIFVITMVIYL